MFWHSSTTRTSMSDMFFLILLFAVFEYMANVGFHCIGICCCETPKRLCGLCVRASLDIVATRKMGEFVWTIPLGLWFIEWRRWGAALLVHSGINDQCIWVINSELRGHEGSLHSDFRVCFSWFGLSQAFLHRASNSRSRWDKGVNASGNAHPADKVKAQANRLICFPCLEIGDAEE